MKTAGRKTQRRRVAKKTSARRSSPRKAKAQPTRKTIREVTLRPIGRAFATAAGASDDILMPRQVIAQLINAVLWVVSHDEIAFDARKGNRDQIKNRWGQWLYEFDRNGKGLIVRFAGDILRGDEGEPHRDERMGMDFRQDDFGDQYPDKTIRPMVQFFAQKGIDTAGDATDIKIISFAADAVVCNVPFYAPNLTGGGGVNPERVFKMTSADGTHEMILQNKDATEGKMLVHYDLEGKLPPKVISRLR